MLNAMPEFPLFPSSFKHLLYKLTKTVSTLALACHAASSPGHSGGGEEKEEELAVES